MRRLDLVSDCRKCAAICCVATPFDASEDFAFAKEAGERCRHLRSDHSCAVHDDLRGRGFLGCSVYDCHGAGPRTLRLARDDGATERERNDAFMVLRVVHELLWLLTEALALCPESSAELTGAMQGEMARLDAMSADGLEALLAADVETRRRATMALLRRVGDALVAPR
jgi:hypothetical protein